MKYTREILKSKKLIWYIEDRLLKKFNIYYTFDLLYVYYN